MWASEDKVTLLNPSTGVTAKLQCEEEISKVPKLSMSSKGKGNTAVLAYEGNLAEAQGYSLGYRKKKASSQSDGLLACSQKRDNSYRKGQGLSLF
eukprot:1155905-Pelagomonas_calceolata.AAC.1